MKKSIKKYNIAILPVMIDAFVEAYQAQYPLTIEEKEKIVAETMHVLHGEIGKNGESLEVCSMDAHILQKMVVILRVPKKDLVSYFNWGMEWWESYIPTFIRNIISNHKNLIDEYVKKRPRAFSQEDKNLWKLFLKNPYANPKQLAGLMGMADRTTFNQACHGLIHSCFNIYKASKFKI